MPKGIGYGDKKKSKGKGMALLRSLKKPSVTSGAHERKLSAAFEVAKRRKG